MDSKILWPVPDFEIEIGRATVRIVGEGGWVRCIDIRRLLVSMPNANSTFDKVRGALFVHCAYREKKPACAMDTSLIRSETIQLSRKAMATETGKDSRPPTLRSFLEETSAHGLRYLVRFRERSCMLVHSLFTFGLRSAGLLATLVVVGGG